MRQGWRPGAPPIPPHSPPASRCPGRSPFPASLGMEPPSGDDTFYLRQGPTFPWEEPLRIQRVGGWPGGPRGRRRSGGAAPGFPGFPSWGPGLMLMEGRSQASEPPPTLVGAHSQQPCSLIRTPGLASRASQITAWLALPMAATPSSGYRALPEGGLVPDKGCHSAGLWAEPGTQAWRGLRKARERGGGQGAKELGLGIGPCSPQKPTFLLQGGGF